MGTKNTLAEHDADEGKASWRIFEELFEDGVVYLEMWNVGMEMSVFADGQNNLVITLPIAAARSLLKSDINWEGISEKFGD